jgi:hypothetical protein
MSAVNGKLGREFGSPRAAVEVASRPIFQRLWRTSLFPARAFGGEQWGDGAPDQSARE